MIQLEAAIDRLENNEDIKILLKQIVAAMNTLDSARGKQRGDLVFIQESSGPVFRGTDGNYYRHTVSVTGVTATTTYTNIGPRPKE